MTIQKETTQNKQSSLQKWSVLIVMSLASFILVLDTTMMNVAISAIVKDLQTTVQGVQAAIAVYALVMGAFMIMGGKLGDIYGMKKTFIIGMIAYGIGTITAAITPNLAILTLGWSIIEGFGAALVLPMTITILALKYRGRDLAFSFAVVGGVQASGAAVGPIFGGFMTSYFSWRWAFASEAIIVAIIFALLFVLPESKRQTDISLDWLGVFLSAAGMAAVVFGIILSSQYGWWHAKRAFSVGGVEIAPLGLSVVPFMIGAGVILLVLFIHWQQKQEDRGKDPLLHVNLLRNGPLMAGVTAGGIMNVILGGAMFTIPVFLQSALQYDAIQSGIALLPLSISMFIFSLSTASLGRKFKPKYVIQFGFLLMIGGVWLIHRVISLELTNAQLIAGFSVFGAGSGLLLAQITNITLSAVSKEENNEASGLNFTFRQLGASLGTAVIGAVLLTLMSTGVVSGILDAKDISATNTEIKQYTVALEDALATMTDAQKVEALSTLPAETRQSLQEIYFSSWIEAEKSDLLVIIAVIVLGMLVSSFLSDQKFK